MTTYDLFKQLLDANGIKTADVARATGITTAAFTQWKQGRMNFKPNKLQLIADFFNVPLTYFYPEAQSDDTYFTDPATIALAQEMSARPEMKTLFDASRNLSPEDLQIVNQLVLKLSEKK